VSARAVFAAGFGLLAMGLLLMVMTAGPGRRTAALLAGVALGAVIVVYDLWHKGNPVSPVLMGAARALVYIGAAATVAGRVSSSVAVGALVLVAYLIGLTYTAKQESLGRIGNWWPLAFLAVPLVYAAPLMTGAVVGVLLYVLLAGWVAYALSLLVRPPRRVPLAVVSLIAGISLVDAALIALQGAPALGWVAVGGFGLTVALQKVVPGT
jgi:4-hydroxybenzoate polyprenyltransferase